MQQLDSFMVIGISTRTTNENNQAATDIPALWQRFIGEQTMGKIPNKTGDSLYCIYTEYEKDHTRPYTTVLGCAVENLESIPDGMTGVTIGQANYEKFEAKGNLAEGAVFNEWTRIWNTDLKRAYTADFEVYDEKSADMANAVVDIFIAVNQ